jgi:hypothetical protein
MTRQSIRVGRVGRGVAVLAAVILATTSCGSSRRPAPPTPAASSSRLPPATATQPTLAASAPADSLLQTPAGRTRTGTDVTPTADRPCGVIPAARYTHVVWIWMENKPYSAVIGSSSAPYVNTLAKRCGLAADYHGVSHPSLPNYLAATGGSTFGVRDDAGPAAHPIGADSIFGQLERAGLSWRSYQESMPSNCRLSAASPYAVKHNPAAYFTPVRKACTANDVPLEGNLQHDLSAGMLPSFSFVTPNLCHDTHDCSVRTGDTWLAEWIPKLTGSPQYRAGNTLLMLTWDEGVGAGNHIPTIVVGPSVPAGSVAHARFDHYALLRTTEDLLGLGHLGAAASAPSMAVDFRLGE